MSAVQGARAPGSSEAPLGCLPALWRNRLAEGIGRKSSPTDSHWLSQGVPTKGWETVTGTETRPGWQTQRHLSSRQSPNHVTSVLEGAWLGYPRAPVLTPGTRQGLQDGLSVEEGRPQIQAELGSRGQALE